MLLAKLRGQKIYNWDHGWYGRETFVKKWIKRAYFGLADGGFLYGNYAKDLMIKNGFEANKLHVIHNSLNYDIQLELRKSMKSTEVYSYKFNNTYPVVIFIGRLTHVKRLDLLIKALGYLKEQGCIYNLVFVGDGEERLSLESIVEQMGLNEQIWFYGESYDESTNAELVYNADLCVAPGNVGLTAMHSMMFGCPVLTHSDFRWQMPEFEAIRDNVTGAFFVRNDLKSLADAINSWFENNKNLREAVRTACYNEIDYNWNPHKQIKIIKSVIYETSE